MIRVIFEDQERDVILDKSFDRDKLKYDPLQRFIFNGVVLYLEKEILDVLRAEVKEEQKK